MPKKRQTVMSERGKEEGKKKNIFMHKTVKRVTQLVSLGSLKRNVCANTVWTGYHVYMLCSE